MAPSTTHDATTEPKVRRVPARRRREPARLGQLPAWGEFATRAEPDAELGGVGALLRGLDPDQRRAVTHEDGPLLVVAGAGTGKTQVITRRIAWLIGTRRAKPSEILALTFTDKAAHEMAVRVDQLVPYGYTDTAIATFHAFGDSLVREYAFELGLPTDLRVLTRAEVIIFLREHLFEFELDRYRPLGDPTRFLGALAALFSRCKDEDISPEAYRTHADRLAAEAAALGEAAGLADPSEVDAAVEDAARQDELARAYGTYQRLLGEAGAMDFGDQVSLALRLLRTSAAIRAEVAGRYRYVLVDEFQDTDRAQAELVALLAEPHRNVTVVGDDDQAIYAFRGAAIENILGFKERYRAARTVVLRRNYRSKAPILAAAHRLVRFNDPDRLEVKAGVSKRLIAQRVDAAAAPVRLESFVTGSDEADWIAAEIGRRVADGARPRDHAILVRANGHAAPFLRALDHAGLPWRFSGTSGLYGRPEDRALLAFLRVVADPDSTVDLYGLATSDPYAIDATDLTAVVGMARRRNRTMWAVLVELETQPGLLRLAPASRTGITRLVEDVRRFVALGQEKSAGEVLYRYLIDSGTLARLTSGESPRNEAALTNVARFFDIVRSQGSLLADGRAAFVAPHFATLIEAGDDPATADVDPDADAVAVLTVHKAKGLEFPVVFLPGLVAGRFPINGRGETLGLPAGLGRGTPPTAASSLAEERRLCYVAMTRARDELILSHAADYGGARARRVSPFVLEALDLPSSAGAPGVGTVPVDAVERLASFDRPEAVPAVAQPTAAPDEPLSLSFGQVDAYLTCPARYRYAHVLRVPLPPHHALVYGSALHKAVQVFHHGQARGRILGEDELIEVFESAWSNEGFISREHEEARLESGRDALRRFRASQLEPGAVVPTYVERDFSFTLGGDRVRGRWDRVDVESMGGPEPAASALPTTDVSTPTLGILGRERVTVVDYKSTDLRDPVKARQRARESLQLQIYAMGYEAMTGRLPDALALHFLGSGLVGRVDVDPKRIAAARGSILRAAAGIRAGEFEARPSTQACGWCPYRDICPSSVAT